MRQDIRPSFSGPRGQARKTAQANSLPGSVLISAIIAINSISANVLIAVIIISSLSGAATYQEEGWQQGMTGVLTQPLLTAQRQQVVVWKQKKKAWANFVYHIFLCLGRYYRGMGSKFEQISPRKFPSKLHSSRQFVFPDCMFKCANQPLPSQG